MENKKKKTEIQTSCDTCAYLIYDEEYEETMTTA